MKTLIIATLFLIPSTGFCQFMNQLNNPQTGGAAYDWAPNPLHPQPAQPLPVQPLPNNYNQQNLNQYHITTCHTYFGQTVCN